MQKKINIGIVIRAISIGGAEKQSILLAKHLKPQFNIFYFVQKKEPCEQQFLDELKRGGISYIQLNGNFLLRVFQLLSVVRKNKIEILFSYLSLDNLLISAAKLFHRKIITVGGIRNSQLPLHKYLITKTLHNVFLDYIIFNNYSGMKSFVEKGFKKSKCISIPNCFEVNIEKEVSTANKDVFTILTVGRFVPQKDYHTALLAYKQLTETNPGVLFRYFIIGYGALEDEIISLINRYNLKGVEVIKKPSNIGYYYRLANVYLCSSLFEGISNTLLEAMAHSLPIVATDAGDNKLLVYDRTNGYIVEPGDYKGMAERISLLYNDEIKRHKFGDEGFKILNANYSSEKFVMNYVEFIEKLSKDE